MTLRIVPRSEQVPAPEPAQFRERSTATRTAGASQKLTADVSRFLTSFASQWLQENALPQVRDWLEERTNRPILVSTDRAARLLDISTATVDRLIAAGTLPVVRVGSRTLIRRADLEAWAEGLPVREVAG